MVGLNHHVSCDRHCHHAVLTRLQDAAFKTQTSQKAIAPSPAIDRSKMMQRIGCGSSWVNDSPRNGNRNEDARGKTVGYNLLACSVLENKTSFVSRFPEHYQR